jgi:hypothetical protein
VGSHTGNETQPKAIAAKKVSFFHSLNSIPVQKPQQLLFFLTRDSAGFLDSARTEHWGSSRKGLLFGGLCDLGEKLFLKWLLLVILIWRVDLEVNLHYY